MSELDTTPYIDASVSSQGKTSAQIDELDPTAALDVMTAADDVLEAALIKIEQEEALLEDSEIEQVLLGSNLSTDVVKDYLRKIGKYPLLKAEQEVQLAQTIELGVFAGALKDGSLEHPGISQPTDEELEILINEGRQALDLFLNSNLRLVVSLAKRYTGSGVDFSDVIQEGNLGLIRAAQKYDYSKGYKFSTYATWWIKQSIMRGLADQSRTIRLPVHMVEQVNRMRSLRRRFLTEQGREATPEELATTLEIPVETVLELIKHDTNRTLTSLNMQLGDDGASEFGELIPDSAPSVEDLVEVDSLKKSINDVLDILPLREAEVIRMRFGLETGECMTLDEIGKYYGVTRERIRQIEAKALARLRHPSYTTHLSEYFEQ